MNILLSAIAVLLITVIYLLYKILQQLKNIGQPLMFVQTSSFSTVAADDGDYRMVP